MHNVAAYLTCTAHTHTHTCMSTVREWEQAQAQNIQRTILLAKRGKVVSRLCEWQTNVLLDSYWISNDSVVLVAHARLQTHCSECISPYAERTQSNPAFHRRDHAAASSQLLSPIHLYSTLQFTSSRIFSLCMLRAARWKRKKFENSWLDIGHSKHYSVHSTWAHTSTQMQLEHYLARCTRKLCSNGLHSLIGAGMATKIQAAFAIVGISCRNVLYCNTEYHAQSTHTHTRRDQERSHLLLEIIRQ